MAEDQGSKEEQKFDFDSSGEAVGYIGLDQAQVRAMQIATEAPGDYGPANAGIRMAFEVVNSRETEDHYIITLSLRPQGEFAGRQGEEQFFLEKQGTVAHRQVLGLPRRRRRLSIVPAVIGVAVVGVIVVGASIVFGSGSDPVPIVVPPTNTPVQSTVASTVAPTASAALLVIPPPTEETPVPTATPVPISPATPTPTPTHTPVPPPSTATATPVPPSPTPTLRPTLLADDSDLVVTKTDDTFDGVCDEDCSLREAIARAEPGSSVGIPAGRYTLGGAQITIDKDLILTGAGAENTIIQAHAFPGEATSRVFEITGGVVTVSGVTIRHGNLSSSQDSGGMNNSGTLTLVESVVSDNIILGRDAHGGGIYSTGTLSLEDSAVNGNKAGLGGEIWVVVALNRSTVNDNTARAGGGIYGGGTFINSTISGNSTDRMGGGFRARENTTLTSTTITKNHAVEPGGGIAVSSGVTVRMVNTLLADNTATEDGPDCAGPITSLGHNFVGHPVGCGLVPEQSDVSGTVDFALDPKLGPLQDNGGATPIHALLAGSPASDNANDGAAPSTDQRGVARPQGAASDIGAFEF